VRDLLPEKEKKMTTQTAREPSMTGAPTYFRVGVSEAKHRKVIGHSADTGKPIRADYSYPGWHLAIHVEEYLDDEALEELEQLADSVDRFGGEEFERKIEAFLKREFPGCMALVPNARRTKFMEGVLKAIEEGRFRIG